jgi:hypothetical protein
MAKEAFNKTKTLFTSKLNFNIFGPIKKEMVHRGSKEMMN